MLEIFDKRTRSQLFRERLAGALTASGMSRAALARAVQVDRSTITQMLAEDDARVPGGHVVAACAQALDISADWLLGLTDRPEPAGKLLASSLSISETGRATTLDDQIFEWQREAEGYKIRHVPATLPDILKTDAVLRWEYAPLTHRRPDQAIAAAAARLDWLTHTLSDFEMAMPLHELQSFARAEGYYAGLSPQIRAAQLDWMIETYDRLFPGLRIYLYDARATFSAPVTVFGPKMAVIYLGRHYLAFRDRDRVHAMARHFDGLIRDARITSHDISPWLKELRAGVC